MAALDIFLFTSLWGEGFGLVVIEAMASEKAVVALNTGPMREIVKNGVTGWLPAPTEWVPEISSLDITPVVDTLRRLIHDRALRWEAGRAARADIITRFGVRRVVERTAETYTRIYHHYYG